MGEEESLSVFNKFFCFFASRFRLCGRKGSSRSQVICVTDKERGMYTSSPRIHGSAYSESGARFSQEFKNPFNSNNYYDVEVNGKKEKLRGKTKVAPSSPQRAPKEAALTSQVTRGQTSCLRLDHKDRQNLPKNLAREVFEKSLATKQSNRF